MKSLLVPTELAITFLVREGVTHDQAYQAIKYWRRIGRLKNHGGRRRGQALWDLAEIQDLRERGVYFTD